MNVIGDIKPQTQGPLWTSDRRLFLDKNGKVVEANSRDKVTLLVAAGGTIPMATAQSLGLVAPIGTKIVVNGIATPDVPDSELRDTITNLEKQLLEMRADRDRLASELETERSHWKTLEDDYLDTITNLEKQLGNTGTQTGTALNAPVVPSFHIEGVPAKVIGGLAEIGVTSIETLKATPDETLVSIPGVTAKILAALKKAK